MGIVACGLQWNACSTKSLCLPKNPYTQVSNGRKALTGTFDTAEDQHLQSQYHLGSVSLILPGVLKSYATILANLVRFVGQAIDQHTRQYQTLPAINIGDFNAEYQVILAKNAPAAASRVDGAHAAVKRFTGIDLARVLAEVPVTPASAPGPRKA